MRYVTRIIVWLVVFLVVLAIRFPYEPVFLRIVNTIQDQTKATITWDAVEANITGAQLKNFQVTMPSGFAFAADTATIRPSLKGLQVECTQTAKGGRAHAQLTRQNLEFSAEKLEAETGSKDFGTVTMSGKLTYALNTTAITGELRLVIPSLSGVLPIPLKNLEIGTVMKSEAAKKESSTISNAITLFGEGLDGSGNVDFTFTKGGSSPHLSGELTVNTQGFGSNTIQLGGTWAQPQWNLAGAQK